MGGAPWRRGARSTTSVPRENPPNVELRGGWVTDGADEDQHKKKKKTQDISFPSDGEILYSIYH